MSNKNNDLFSFLACLLSVCFSFSTAAAQDADFFWSLNDIGEGVVNEPLDIPVDSGTSATLYLYYSPNGPADTSLNTGFFLDIESTDPDVFRFVSAETLDFPVTVNSIDVGLRRWDGGGINDFAYGDTGTVSDGLVEGLAAFTFTSGSGISEFNDGGVFLDEGYDVPVGAFQVAKVQLQAMGDAFESSFIRISVGSGQIVHTSCTQVVKPTSHCAALSINFPDWCGMIGAGGCTIDPPPCGDVNGDGVTNLLDVPAFVNVLTNGGFNNEADLNEDDVVNLLDVDPFVDLLNGSTGKGDPVAGDVNCDGSINLLDAACMVQLILDGQHTNECDTVDINQDGLLNLLDVELLAQLVLDEN